MNKYQSNKYSMYRSVNEVLTSYKSYFAKIKRLSEAAVKFGNYFTEIEKTSAINETISKGYAGNKTIAGNELADSLIKVAGVLYIAASDMKNDNLKSLAAINMSELRKMRINHFVIRAKEIFKQSKENISLLLNIHENIEAEIRELEKKINNYENILKTKEKKSAEKISSTNMLKEEFKNSDYILNNELDKLIELVKTENTDFYNQYKAARSIKDLGIKKKKVI
jgi:hypothetical protein